MARTDKYYGTYSNISGEMYDKIVQLGYKGSHNQFRIVCKAKSMAEANRKASSYGLSNKTFSRDYTSETGNSNEIEMADKFEFIINTEICHGKSYTGIKELLYKEEFNV